jgi:DNA topoisomerase-1
MKKGDKLPVKKLDMLSKQTAPPPRWSQAAIIKEMEKRELGTRATRAAILQTLYDRYYVTDKTIRVTDLGMSVAKTLKKYVPDLVDEKLTRKFEKEIEQISQEKIKKEKLFEQAKKALIKISDEFRAHEEDIGKELGKAIITTQEDRNTLGPCPNCGANLKIMFSPWTKKSFVGCSAYSKCKACGFSKKACKCACPICGGIKGKCKCEWKAKEWKPTCATGYPLPAMAMIQRLDKICEKCKTPMIQVVRKGKRPFRMCLDPKCETKADWNKPGQPRKKAKKAKAAPQG